MDIVEWLRQFKLSTSDSNYNALIVNGKTEEAADEIERLREALKIFAGNVNETNVGIDKNWAETVYALKAENHRLRETLRFYADKTRYQPEKVWTTSMPQYEPDGYKLVTPVLADKGARARIGIAIAKATGGELVEAASQMWLDNMHDKIHKTLGGE